MAYGTGELVENSSTVTRGLRCQSKKTKPLTIAAVSGAPELALLTPLSYNKSTGFWNVFQDPVLDVYTITGTGTGATFTLTITIGGVAVTTGTIAYNASAATVLAALVALAEVDVGDFTATGGALATNPVVLTATATGQFANKAAAITITDSTTGGTTVLVHTTTFNGQTTGSDGLAFVWPLAIQTSASTETLGVATFSADIHLDDIPLVTGVTLAALKTFLQTYARDNDFDIQGLIKYH